MPRFPVLIVVMALVACSGGTEATSTTVAPTTAPPPTSSTTTTTAPTTTTTLPRPEISGAGPQLTRLMHGLYDGTASAPGVPDVIRKLLAGGEGDPPAAGTTFSSEWDDGMHLAVIEAGDDITLAVADPEWRIIGGWWPSQGVGAYLREFPKLVAVVGSDARPKENREATRADSIHFVGIDAEGNAGIVGVPRDSWVPIPGAGSSKINASLAFGGPDMMMDTFTELTGLDFDGYLLTGFAGFEGLIDLLGGLAMDVPRDFNDQAAKAYLQAGEQVLNAAEALALSRVRKTIPGGDFQRQEHGGLVMMAAQSMVKANGPHGLPELLAGARPHVSTDLGPGELLVLAAAITRVDPDRVVNVVAPGGVGTAGGASVVFLSDSANQLWEDLADGSLEPADG